VKRKIKKVNKTEWTKKGTARRKAGKKKKRGGRKKNCEKTMLY